ncbi:AlpA family transcriptional regulator [Limnohabitans sp. Bal53]|uniref:helix-turn-helix transcriptional regulator n=1 Tax=Limnohabitans sp. Bal53 TaxID=1977910 RepID=UPI000D37A215|nr:AlpA family phage regulatory protein [Limnohabitans sp. Bal53]PUE39073.1 AlpA family transcriptional regulator [Limnohabitans sp. Bal53]
MHTYLPPTTESNHSDSLTILRLPAVTRLTGLCRSTIYRLVAEDKFPSPVKLSSRAIGWHRSDLERWSAARPTANH